jgi:hypothetical protein
LGVFTKVDEILAGLASEEGESHPAANALAPYIKRYDVNGILILLGRMRIMANEN